VRGGPAQVGRLRAVRTPPRVSTRSCRGCPAPSGLHAPLAVARSYVSVRNSYRYDDPTGYAVALTAPAYTTAAFAARSRPTATELARVRLAQEVSTFRVLTARVDGEAPNTATTRYVDVTFLGTQAYRGDGSGRVQRQVWTLRLLRDHAGRWWVGECAAELRQAHPRCYSPRSGPPGRCHPSPAPTRRQLGGMSLTPTSGRWSRAGAAACSHPAYSRDLAGSCCS